MILGLPAFCKLLTTVRQELDMAFFPRYYSSSEGLNNITHNTHHKKMPADEARS